MLHATTWESCPAELLLSAAAPEDTGKDARLLEQLKQQNRRGLERVMKRYTAYVGTILRNVTRGQTTQEDLEELTADVFLALWHHAPEMRTEHLTGYLASIARSKGYNWLRKNRPETMPIDDVVISDDTDVSAQAEQAELAGIVQEMLAQLPEQDRELLLRFYFYRQSVREIAGEMHMKESTVKTRMYRSRRAGTKSRSALENGTDSGGADRGGSAGQRQCDHRGSGNRWLFPADAAGVRKRRFVSVHAGRSVHCPRSGSDGHL